MATMLYYFYTSDLLLPALHSHSINAYNSSCVLQCLLCDSHYTANDNLSFISCERLIEFDVGNIDADAKVSKLDVQGHSWTTGDKLIRNFTIMVWRCFFDGLLCINPKVKFLYILFFAVLDCLKQMQLSLRRFVYIQAAFHVYNQLLSQNFNFK